ncbi:MAG: hypothetical protein PHE27_08865 [Alphaproteobacteria bacterium]|nr:hypothetical protein [Alphaproteobacteria bacterium]
MSPLAPKSPANYILTASVTLIIMVSLVVSAASVRENLLFGEAVSQILWFINTVRTFEKDQKTYTLSSGQDVWANMVQAGRISVTTKHTNPWGGDFQVTAGPNDTMRIENIVPTHNCRRLALYMLESGPEKIGLVAMGARSEQNSIWNTFYPKPTWQKKDMPDISCGVAKNAHLAMIFKMKF